MFRNTAWRKTAGDVVSWHQDQALSTTMFILKEFGPTGFLLKEDDEPKQYKVCLGDPHTCTCGTFQKHKEPCKHICWILMRKFRLPKDHEYCFQQGLVERQILEVLQGLYRTRTPRPSDSTSCAQEQPGSSQEEGTVRQKVVTADDVCPVCQEELLLKRLPVTHCRFGCGNNIHISCMKVWADHQSRSETDAMVKCPLCRKDFGTLTLLLKEVKAATQMCTSLERERLDRHLGLSCHRCGVCPVVGRCYRCAVCPHYHLCEECFKNRCHPQHSFAVRLKRNQSWQLLEHSVGDLCTTAQITHTPAVLINGEVGVMADGVPAHVLKNLPVIRVRQSSRLLEVGVQCRLCLCAFRLGQLVKTLPCGHKFHAGCIETWLHQSVCCPLDWQDIHNPLTWENDRGGKDRTSRAPALLKVEDLREGPPAPLSFEMLVQGTRCLCITGTRSSVLGLTPDHSRELKPVPGRRSGSLAPGSSSRGRAGNRTQTSPHAPGRTGGSGRPQRCLFLRLPELKSSTLHEQIRPAKHGSRTRPQHSGDLSDFEPGITGIPFSTEHQRNQE
ncbi:E3 ubiquitin-protein ligase ZSWIM2 isoform X2 [Brachyhypopomus gauderio]|uniref:E3 ubiquitin-protein ligase ZSWIM2 isoform X2 n=1 Tax=Brachyhypopomus gauderio TaxID=698409 RepID=UPI00404161AC